MSKVHLTNNVLEKEIPYQGRIILRYNINYPSFSSDSIKYSSFLNQINAYYYKKAMELHDYSENELKKIAIDQAFITSAPVELMLSYTISYNDNAILSLYLDQYEFLGGAHGTTTRSANSWDLEKQKEIKLNEIKDDNTYFLEQISEQIKKDPTKYYSDALTLLPNMFNENNFYLTPQTLVIFFQEYEIAPYVSGIVEFPIPYSTFCPTSTDATSFLRYWKIF